MPDKGVMLTMVTEVVIPMLGVTVEKGKIVEWR